MLSLLGAVSINLGQLDQAARYLDEALHANPSHHSAHDNLGVLLARQERYAEAAASFQRAVALNPQAVMTQVNLANAIARSGQVEESIEVLRRAAKLSPTC